MLLFLTNTISSNAIHSFSLNNLKLAPMRDVFLLHSSFELIMYIPHVIFVIGSNNPKQSQSFLAIVILFSSCVFYLIRYHVD